MSTTALTKLVRFVGARGLKCGAEDKLWGQRRESWKQAITTQKRAIAKVRHEPSGKLHKLMVGGPWISLLQNSLRIKGHRAFKVLNIIATLIELCCKRPSFLGLSLKEVLYLAGGSWSLEHGNLMVQHDAQRETGDLKLSDAVSETAREKYGVLLAFLEMAGQRTLVLENRKRVEPSSSFREL